MKKPLKKKQKDQNSVHFEIVDPNAQKVCIAGSFNEWQPEPMAKSLNDRSKWIKELPLSSGQHEYLFIIDGRWCSDPKAKEAIPNPYGSLNSLLIVD